MEGEDFANEEANFGEFVVGGFKLGLLVRLIVESADDAKAGQVFAGDEGDFVEEFLVNLELGDGEAENDDTKEDDGADASSDGPGHVGRGLEGLENGAKTHERRAEHHGEHHHDGLLNLTDVIGGASDEGGGGEVVDFGDAEA